MSTQRQKTPLRYYSTKQKPYDHDFITNYLKAPSTSASELDLHHKARLVYKTKKPIIPIQPFIVDMPFNLVIAIEDGAYSMIEVIKIKSIDQKDIWFILESKFNGNQTIALPDDPKAISEISEIAKLLNIKTYKSGLKVEEIISGSGISDKNKILTVSYERTDLDNPANKKKINLKATIPLELEPSSEIARDTLLPKTNKRLSHGMNHSAANMLALIDIYQAVPTMKLGKIKIDFLNTDIQMQRILGINIKSPIAQLVMGLSSRTFTQAENEKKLIQISETVYRYTLSENMGHLDYHFNRIEDGRMELAQVSLFTAGSNKAKGKIFFNPSLPDFRYSLPNVTNTSRIVMALSGVSSEELLAAYVGEVRFQNDHDLNGKMIEIRAGDMDTSHRERFLKTPEWPYKRPFFSHIRKESESIIKIQTTSLAPGHHSPQEEIILPTEKLTLKTIEKADLNWLVRPHRLSRLVLRTSQQKEAEANQKEIAEYKDLPAPQYILGGTWGNGTSAADLTSSNFVEGTIRPKSHMTFFQLTTPMLPMRQNINEYSETGDYFPKEKAEITLYRHLIIPIPTGKKIKTIIPFINGLKFQSAANHLEISVTSNSLSYKILKSDEAKKIFNLPSMILDSAHNYHLVIEIKKGFGPELSRPYRGPIRQSLHSYAGYGALDIGLIASGQEEKATFGKVNGKKNVAVRLGLPGQLTDTINHQFSEVSSLPEFLPLSLSFENVKPSTKERTSRYIKSLTINLSSHQLPDKNWHILIDNMGEITWATQSNFEIDFIKTNLFK